MLTTSCINACTHNISVVSALLIHPLFYKYLPDSHFLIPTYLQLIPAPIPLQYQCLSQVVVMVLSCGGTLTLVVALLLWIHGTISSGEIIGSRQSSCGHNLLLSARVRGSTVECGCLIGRFKNLCWYTRRLIRLMYIIM